MQKIKDQAVLSLKKIAVCYSVASFLVVYPEKNIIFVLHVFQNIPIFAAFFFFPVTYKVTALFNQLLATNIVPSSAKIESSHLLHLFSYS